MPRRKTDPLLSALISKLPPAGPWPADQQKRWLDMMGVAFTVVYGGPVGGGMSASFAPVSDKTATQPKPSYPFVIDADGYARRGPNGKRIKPSDVTGPIFDMRGEDGDMRTITWADESKGLNGADLTIVAA